MKTGLYAHLAFESLKKNYRLSIPFIGGGILMASMLYSILSMYSSPELSASFRGEDLIAFLQMGVPMLMLFTLIFFFYLNSVWLRSRSKENALFMVLGMEKRHLIHVQFDQLLICALATIPGGLLVGICMDKLLSLLLCRILEVPPLLGFSISWTAITGMSEWILFCFAALSAWSALQIMDSDPLKNLKGEPHVENKIRIHWFGAACGILLLADGYTLAVTIRNPIVAFALFFVAVLLVIAGTYLLFLFGAEALIALLQKDKRYYYSPRHFVSLSILKYRLRQNAAALANIAILSTMILVTLSTTVSLVVGVQKTVEQIYPTDAQFVLHSYVYNDFPASTDIEKDSLDALEKMNIQPAENWTYGTTYAVYQAGYATESVVIIDINDYNRLNGKSISLEDDELLPIEANPNLNDRIVLLRNGREETYFMHQKENDPLAAPFGQETNINMPLVFAGNLRAGDPVSWNFYCNLGDQNTAETMNLILKEYPQNLDKTRYPDDEYSVNMHFQREVRSSLLEMYSSMLFLGIYLCALFILAVVLIMYYKQVSEGAEDRRRFAILQKVGLDREQLRRIIGTQSKLVFFLPLTTALLHILFAFPMIRLILEHLVLCDPQIFFWVMLTCFGIFALIYALIYRLTARTYYKITVQNASGEYAEPRS